MSVMLESPDIFPVERPIILWSQFARILHWWDC